MVVCHPGTKDVAKSMDTTECTERTSGVDKPASTSDTSSKRCQFFAVPVQPKLKTVYQNLAVLVFALSRTAAKSGISPVYQNTKDTEK